MSRVLGVSLGEEQVLMLDDVLCKLIDVGNGTERCLLFPRPKQVGTKDYGQVGCCHLVQVTPVNHLHRADQRDNINATSSWTNKPGNPMRDKCLKESGGDQKKTTDP